MYVCIYERVSKVPHSVIKPRASKAPSSGQVVLNTTIYPS